MKAAGWKKIEELGGRFENSRSEKVNALHPISLLEGYARCIGDT